MVDLIDFDEERRDDVVMDQFEVLVADPVLDVALVAGEEVVHRDHLVALQHQSVHKMTADEAGSTGHENSLQIFVRQVLHFRVAFDGQFIFQALDPRLQLLDARLQVVVLADHLLEIIAARVDASAFQMRWTANGIGASRVIVEKENRCNCGGTREIRSRT